MFKFRDRNRAETEFIRLDTRKCKACWECVENCREGVFGKIEFFKHKHSVIKNPDNCIGCETCVSVCEYGAVEAVRR